MLELLSPAGNMEKLKVAFKFGADACYLAGKKFGLRAFSGNFDEKELRFFLPQRCWQAQRVHRQVPAM